MTMGLEKYLKKNVCIELKNGSKYFGVIINIDSSPKLWSWITLEKNNKIQDFADSEIVRVEVLE